ncbi:coagulation factor 5/8 type domain-containing protein [Parapedobacter sp. SGR-10]|uniref:right-handed parallel beta-helix repeat-containing protein n=1 Tax=Parapedobacter sp. SGR-10 TaxID=2710879 RepID=UPI0013D61CAE|nr:right-handed parallel beta-helix repeat-containing protein [Parapedobacter sp. SGR-10]NGF55597.1 coagulation factor 5/8 type domain-containing protein [Parapedobacter sp. SGR-10]
MKLPAFLILLISAISCKAASLAPDTAVPSAEDEPVKYTLVQVQNVSQLKKALAEAQPGDSIVLAPGTYEGKFVLAKSGTTKKPIVITGSGDQTILDAGSTQTGYVFHLQADYCKIKNMALQNGLKGLMADGSSFNVFEGLIIRQVGEEGLHLRKFSSNNLIQHCTISDTGLKRPGYGEGVYIGTANSNWAKYTDGKPDASDANTVVHNTIGPNITAECIDIKEGTSNGLIAHNEFYATGISGENSADSWLDVKGNTYRIEHNKGFHDGSNVNFLDGIQVNCAYEGWGSHNVFTDNQLEVNAAGHAINIRLKSSKGEAVGNIVYNTNTQKGAQKGLTNIAVTNK